MQPPQLQDTGEINGLYKHWRTQLVLFMFLGYSCFYMSRKSFTFVMPFIADDLGFSKTDLGAIATILYITYGISKLLSGVLADKSNPRYFMAFGLIITGILNITFGFCSSVLVFGIIWGLNGIFQAWGWPAITKILTYWFEKKKRGTWWSVCNTAHNIGGGLLPLFSVFLAATFNWRLALFVPGIISIIMGFVLIHRLRDIPQSLGLPAVEDKLADNSETSVDISIKDILFKQVLSNHSIWLLAGSYFAIYVIRMALGDWGMFFFIEEKNYSPTLAGSAILWFEVGGFIGVLSGGWVSDRIFKGNRLPYCFFCFLSIILGVSALWYNPFSMPGIDFIYMTLLGFLVFGPQMLVGLAASENVDKRAAATANGFVGLFAYIGAACAGMPLGMIIDRWHWQGFFYTLLASTIIGVLFILIILIKQQFNNHQTTLQAVNA
jgi:MFS transporter, OPA family, sugar phosphate sensor protein UhpC